MHGIKFLRRTNIIEVKGEHNEEKNRKENETLLALEGLIYCGDVLKFNFYEKGDLFNCRMGIFTIAFSIVNH